MIGPYVFETEHLCMAYSLKEGNVVCFDDAQCRVRCNVHTPIVLSSCRHSFAVHLHLQLLIDDLRPNTRSNAQLWDTCHYPTFNAALYYFTHRPFLLSSLAIVVPENIYSCVWRLLWGPRRVSGNSYTPRSTTVHTVAEIISALVASIIVNHHIHIVDTHHQSASLLHGPMAV